MQDQIAQTTEAAPVSHEVTLFAEPLTHIGNFIVTNSLIMSWVVVVIIILLSAILRATLKTVPGKLQNIFEMLVEGALNLCDQVTNDRAVTLKVFPIAICVFVFVLLNNWLGILPLGGFGVVQTSTTGASLSSSFVPFLRGGTADVNTTIALAIMAVVGANIFGIVSLGIWKSFNKYVNLKAFGQIFTKIKEDKTIIIVAPITFFVGILEIIGEFAKIASLSFRLFGNVFAGEVLLASMAALVAYVVPIPFLFLEILVGAIQAMIFAILLVVYFTIASTDHDEHAHEEHREEHHIENKESIIINHNPA